MKLERCSHILLLIKHVNPDYDGIVPGKLFEYIGVQRPILALVPDGEARDHIERLRKGVVAAQDDIEAIAIKIGDLYGRYETGTLDDAFDLSPAPQFDRASLAGDLARSHAIAFSGPVAQQRVTLSGEDVSGAIRTQAVGSLASGISAFGAVRAALFDLQRSFAAEGGIVAEGRDLGTVVFPDAEAKFFLTAASEVRAQRRLVELTERGESPSFDEVLREVLERDRRDSQRSVAPLRKPDDAIEIDASSLSVPQVVARIVEQVRGIEAALAQGSHRR